MTLRRRGHHYWIEARRLVPLLPTLYYTARCCCGWAWRPTSSDRQAVMAARIHKRGLHRTARHQAAQAG